MLTHIEVGVIVVMTPSYTRERRGGAEGPRPTLHMQTHQTLAALKAIVHHCVPAHIVAHTRHWSEHLHGN